jgi:hypothetical protein
MQEELLAAGKQTTARERLTASRERRQLRAGAETRDGGSNRSFALAFLGFLAVLYAAIGYGLYLAVTALF